MPILFKIVCNLGILTAGSFAFPPQKAKPASDEPMSLVITFKEGHQQSFSMSDITRVQYMGVSDASLSPDYFLGKWEVGDGNGGTFTVVLESNGEAGKTLGAAHGIWMIEGREARISWDDGWHDVIRKVGDAHEKLAFAPGTTVSDKPENVTDARKLGPQP